MCKLFKITPIFFALFLYVSMVSNAFAAPTITEVQTIGFGTTLIPQSGSVTTIVDTEGNISGTSTYVAGVVQEGIYTIKSTAGGTISIDVECFVACSGAAYHSAFTAKYDGSTITLPASGLADPGNTTGKTLKVGGTITVDSTMVEYTDVVAIRITVTDD